METFRKFLSNENYKKYLTFILKNFILKSGRIRECPSKNCTEDRILALLDYKYGL